MPKNTIGFCPLCHDKLIATKLTCTNCGLELSNDFSLNPFSYLTESELSFIEVYLKCKGNLKEVQKTLNLSYLNAKKQLEQVLGSLGYVEEEKPINIEVILSELPIYQDESPVTSAIKKRLNISKGLSVIPLPRGGQFQIYYETFGNGIIASNLPSNHVLTWSAFDAAIEVLQNNNGKALKGQAMKSRLGGSNLTLDTVEGYVASKAYGVQRGESVIRSISALSAILEWCGICKNGYGYLELL